MMVLVSHPDAIVSKEPSYIYTWLGTQAPIYVFMYSCVSQPLERDLNREPWPVGSRVNSKMSKLDGKDEESRAGAIYGNDLFTRVGRVMN